MKFRREFLIKAPLGLLAVATAARAEAAPQDPPPGAPPTFGATPAVGPEVSPATFSEAEKLVQVTMTPSQRAMAAKSWRVSMASMQERRSGPRKLALEADLVPATQWNPV
ncbi:MAG: amidase, partial [Massilia sp.]|nr:amidase [Massilia sp.]